jgi:putative phosphoribosyl transferase
VKLMYERNQIFADRTEAGRRLAKRLRAMDLDKPVVLALPRGGVPVGYEIARELKAPLDVLLVRKIGAPGHEEFALGAVVEAETPIVVLNEAVPSHFLPHVQDVAARQALEIERRRQAYRGGLPLVPVAGRTAIVVDDGIATGATFRAALEAMKLMDAAKVVAAIPVAPADSLPAVEELADEVVCLATPEPFYAVGLHYGDFSQTTDEEVVDLLGKARQWSEQLDSNQRPPRPERGALPG